jgi:hypothetical protein
MAEFCTIRNVNHWRFGQWGMIKMRMLDRVLVSFEPGTGGWFDLSDIEFREDVPGRVWETHFS